MDFFLALSLFGLKVFIIIVAIAVIALIFLMVIQKSQQLKPFLEIENLNDHFNDLEQTLKSQLLNKKELKKFQKTWDQDKKQWDNQTKKKIFVLDFKGDVKAHAADHLREEVTAILTLASSTDEVVVKVESPGGVVHGYGFCASQLQRFRSAQIPLTICVDKVAASGGYMMAAVANKIIAAPFAIVGSIGVVAQVPNFHRLLKKHDVDYKEYTAGEFKRTVSLMGEITEEGESKFKSQLEETHVLFKNHIHNFRPQLDINKIATGEYWYGLQAMELGLIDEVNTSDDYLMKARKSTDIIKISVKTKKNLSEKISDAFGQLINQVLCHWTQARVEPLSIMNPNALGGSQNSKNK